MNDSVNLKFAMDLGNISSTLKKLTTNLQTTGKTGKNSFGGVTAKTKAANAKIVNLNKDLTRTNKLFASIGTGLSSLGTLIGIGSLYAVVDTLSNYINSAVAAIETQNLFTVALGESADAADEFVTSLSAATGLDYSNLQNAVGTYALLAKSMGFTTEQAETLSTSTTALALDISSLTNTSIEQVMADLKSGLLGQSETVYKYGVDVTEAGIKQEALAQGITKSVRNMSQGEKMALRYAVYIRTFTKDLGDGTSVVGDFARTINQPANQLKILSNQFITLGRSIGNIFIPILAKVLPYVNAIVSILIDAANALAKLFGFTKQVSKSGIGADSMVEDADNATEAIDGTTAAAKKLNKTILGIDELNLMAAQTDTASSDTGTSDTSSDSILDGLDLSAIENMFDGVSGVSEELKTKLEPILKRIAILVGVIGGMFLLWKISSGLVNILVNLPTTLYKIQKALTLIQASMQMFVGLALIIGGCVLAFVGLNGILKENETSWKNLALAVGGVLLAILGVAVISTALAPYAALIGGITLAFVGFKTAISSANPSLQTFLLTLSGIAIAAVALGFIFTPIVGIVGAIVAVLALIGVYIYKYRKQIADFFVMIGSKIADFAVWLFHKVGEIGWKVLSSIGTFFATLGTTIADFAVWLFNKVVDIGETVITSIGNFFTTIGNSIVTFVTETIPNFVTAFGEFMMELPNKIAYALGFAIGTLAKWALEFIAWSAENIPILIDNIKTFFMELPDKIYNAIITVKDKIVTWVSDLVSTIVTEVPKIINAVIDFFKELPSKIYDVIISVKDKIVIWASNVISTVRTEVTKIITAIVDFFKELPTKVYNAIIGVKDKLVTWGSDVITTVKTEVPKIINSIVDFFKDIPNKITTALTNLGSAFKDIGTFILKGIMKGLSDIGDEISSWCDSFVDGIQDGLGIHSPSVIMRDKVGKYLGEGIFVGLDNTKDLIVNSATSIADGVQGAFDSVTGLDTESLIPTEMSMNLGSATLTTKYNTETLSSVGENNDISASTISGVSGIISENNGNNNSNGNLNLYIEGVYSGTIQDYQRKNLRSGKVVIPIT